jgi:hypothetical protein
MHDHDTAIREQTPVVAAAPHEPDRAELPPAEEWLGDLSELPPRPRRRLLTPAPLALIVVLLLALGFIGGVLVEKGQSASSTAATGAATAARVRGFAAAGGAAGLPGGGAGAAGGAGGARPTSGTVAYVSGQTLYVTTGESTVQVKTSAATSVTKTVKSTVKSIHPGETVTVTGSKGTNGTLTAESIRVGSTGGLGGLFAGAGAGGKGASGSSAGTGSGGPALFGGG